MSRTTTNYNHAYLAIAKNPLIYQDSLADSSSVILRETARTLEVTRAGLWLMSDDRSQMTCLSLYDSRTDEFESGAVIDQAQFPAYFDALFNSRVVDAVDTFIDPRTSALTDPYLRILDVQSLLDATIRSAGDGGLQGVICAEMVGEKRQWTPDEKMFVASIADLLAQRLIASELAWSAQAYQSIYETTSEGIMVFDDGVFREVNSAACEMFGAEASEMIGRSPVDFSPEFQPDGRPSGPTAMAFMERCREGSVVRFDWVHRRVDGTDFDAEITLNRATIAGEASMFAFIRDISAEKANERKMRAAKRELEFRATHDSLTGLLNRDQLHMHVQSLIDEKKTSTGQSTREVALLLLDLNRFKEINDTLGHSTGDKVLVAVARSLDPYVSAIGGTLFRLGGDEFVAVFDSDRCRIPFADLVTAIRGHLQTTIDVDGVSFEMSASIGVSRFPDDGSDSHELLRCADVAMYHGKKHDGASLWYHVENDVNDRRRLAMVGELRRAIETDELVLHFQPRVNIQSGATTGCEALVRWQHPTLGLVPPCEFLPLAEMSDLIHPLTAWVIDNAIDQIQRLLKMGLWVPVAVNVSARNLPDSHLFDLIESKLAKYQLAPELLEIEITESALINNPQRSLQNLQRLEKLGVSIAIDDFGTGYSSLSMLKELPLDKLKIDRSFVNDMLNSAQDRVLVSSTVSLAHNFSASVVAEGVEDQATLDALEALHCEEAQGFYIARPMPADAFEAWLSEASELPKAA